MDYFVQINPIGEGLFIKLVQYSLSYSFIPSLKIIEFIPAQKVVWLVTANYFSFTEDKTEWVGDKLLFEIAEKDGKTEIRFTQEGLTPEYECYDVCNDGWSNYINKMIYLR